MAEALLSRPATAAASSRNGLPLLLRIYVPQVSAAAPRSCSSLTMDLWWPASKRSTRTTRREKGIVRCGGWEDHEQGLWGLDRSQTHLGPLSPPVVSLACSCNRRCRRRLASCAASTAEDAVRSIIAIICVPSTST